MDTDTASDGHRNEHGCGSTRTDTVSHSHGRTMFEINTDMYRVLNVYEH